MDVRAIRTEPTAGPDCKVAPRRRRWPWRLAAVAAIGLAIYATSGWWLPASGRWLNVGESPVPADYCLVLAGDFESRPFGAAALYRKGYIRHDIWLTRVVADGPHLPIGLDSQAATKRILTTIGVPEDRIAVLDGDCASTFDEAQSLKRMLANHPDETVAVVTSDFHTRRSRWIFRQVLGDDADRLQFISVPTDYFNAENWWTVDEGFATYTKEFLKLPFYYLRYGWGWVWIFIAVAIFVGIGFVRRFAGRRRTESTGSRLSANATSH